MKNKARLLLGKLTLIIILLLNVNCEKDEELHSFSKAVETNTESNLKFTEGTFKDLLEKKEFKKTFSEYEDLQNKILLNSTTRKDIDLQNFTIDYSVVKEINYKDRTTYTFSVNRATKKSFYENIVLEKKKEENITAFLLRYYPKETPVYVKEHDTHSFKGKVVVFKIDPNFNSLAASSNCYSGGEWVCVWGGEEHTAGSKCFAANDGRVYFKEFDGDCTRDEPLGGFGGGGGGNGANNSGPGESDIITSLTFPDGSTYTSKLTSRLSLNVQESNFLNNNRLIAEDILNFLKKNNNVEGENEARDVIKAISSPISVANTTRTQLISEIRLKTNAIIKYGIPQDKEIGLSFQKMNTSFSDFSEFEYDELYNYYKKIWDFHYTMQLNRVKIIITAVVVSFKPVIEFALMEVGGTITLKILQKIPAKFITKPILKIINRLTSKSSPAFSKLKHAKKYGIKSYKELGKQFDDLGIKISDLNAEKHHLIEQRFAQNPNIVSKLGSNTDEWLSIVVSKTNKATQSEHYLFSRAWQKAIGTGTTKGTTGYSTSNVPYDVLMKTAKEIYKDYPEILKALGI